MADDLTDDERVLSRAHVTALRLAEDCAELKARSEDGLEQVVNAVVSELQDQGFSQLEIRRAFHNALAEMDP
jgi:hypothetical protein